MKTLAKNKLRWCAIAVGIVCATFVIHTQSGPAPILVVVNSSSSNPYGSYLAEILRAEGITAFSTAQLSSVTSTTLSNASLVILAETSLTTTQSSMFSNYVTAGGRLVAMRPDSKLATVLGLVPAGTSTSEGYVGIQTNSLIGEGLPATTLPFHGSAQNHGLATGAVSVATLYSNQTTATQYPAVVKFGRTVTWSYDLARSIVYSRQGNPANAGVDRDGLPPIRTNDVFYQAIDLDRVQIPHADYQMRLLARLVQELLSDQMPLPRLWYFPNALRTVLVLTGDAHANPVSYFEQELASVEAKGAQISLYLAPGGAYDPQIIANWRARGHEVGMHPAAFPNPMSQAYQTNFDWFTFGGFGPPSRTVRNHFVEWLGWVGAAQLQASFDIGMDTSFYTWGPAVTYPDGHQAHGYITGSGLPMRFVDQSGVVIPVYQQVTSLVDEQLAVGDYSEHLPNDQAIAVSRQLIDESQAGGHSAITTQFHVDYYSWGEVLPWAEGTMEYARSLGIPMWTAERWLDYNLARSATTIQAVSWSLASRQLSFGINVPTGSEPLSVALPGRFDGFGVTSVSVDGNSSAVTQQIINGRETSFFNVGPGSHLVFVTYTTPVPPPQHIPVAVDDTAATNEVQAVTIPVLANDSDLDNDPLTVISVTAPAATVVINADGTLTYTPNLGTCGIDTFTYTISDGRGGTDSATVSVTVTCLNGQVTDSTAAHFDGACTVAGNTIVTRVGDGEVRLAGLQGDAYTSAPLNTTKWLAGSWSGGTYNPTFASGVLSLGAGGYVRSVTTLPVTTLEASARFTGAPWEHVGWGSLDFGNGYAVFSTYNQPGSLFARTDSGGGEQLTNLGPLPAGFHTYRIERQTLSPTSTQVTYYIDGILRAQHTVGTLPSMYVYQSHNGGGASTLDIDRLWVYPNYVASGSFDSCTMDLGAGASSWTTATWDATVPGASTLQLRTRTSTNGSTWSGWSAPLVASGQDIASPPGRYLQYRLELTTGNSAQGPVVDSVTMHYADSSLPQQHSPIAVSDTASTLEATPITIAVLANDVDPDTDPLTLTSTTQGAHGSVVINGDQTLTYTPTIGACGPDTFSYSISDGRGGTATTTVSVNVACVIGRMTHSTVVDFDGACSISNNAIVTRVGDGEIRLAGTQGDEYGAILDSAKWLAGSWSGGAYDPTLTGGVLSLATGGYVRSVSTMALTTLEASAQFAATPWQHLGWSSLDFEGGYAVFSSYNQSTNLLARTNSGSGEQQTDLGPLPTGFHVYRIERQSLSPTSDQVSYYIDGILRAQHTVGALAAMHVYQSHNGAAGTLDVDRLWVYPNYVANGSFQSCTMDLGSDTASWSAATWDAVVPAGSTLQLLTRTSVDGSTWSDWSAPITTSGQAITSPAGRYLQYLLELATSNPSVGAVVNSVTMQLQLGDIDATQPVLSGIGASGVTADAATVSWTSNEAATSQVQYGTTQAYGLSTTLSGNFVTAHSQGLTELTGGLLYHYRVVSRDAAGNETASPDFTFTTPAPSLTLSNVSVIEGQSGTVNATFTLVLSAPSNQTVSVNYATANASAVAPGDYVASSGPISFVPGDTSQNITVTVNGDALSEANETFVINLTNVSNATLTSAQAVGTILNDDPLPTMSVNNVTFTEGTSGAQNANFVVSLSAASGQTITVDYATANGTAIAGSDYATRSGTLTFSPGQTSQTVAVPVTGDTTPEADETFTFNLSAAVNVTLTTTQVTGTILDTDGTVSVTAPNTNVTWIVGSSQNITWSHNLGTGATVQLELSRNGGSNWELITAAAASASATTGSFSWTVTGPTTTSARVRATWTVNGEATDTSNTNFAIVNPPSISVSNISVTEGSSGTTNANFQVTLSQSISSVVTVNYTTANGTATAPGDYSTRSGTLNFAAGTTTQTVSVPVVGDVTAEADETFTFNLSAPTNATLATTQATATILDTDGTVQVTAPNTNVNWLVGSVQTITWTHNLGVGATVRLELSRNSGNTWELITASAVSTGATTGGFNWTVTGPATSNARVRVTWTSNAEATDTSNTNFAIVNPPSISVSNISVTEGSSGTTNANFQVTLSQSSSSVVTVNYTTANGTATAPGDYSTRSGTLNFAAGTTTQTVSVPVVGDVTPEADKTFTFNLSAPTNATLATTQATATILDTDGTVQVTAPNTNVNWLAGSVQTITWTHNLGVGATVQLELSRNSGNTWQLITASAVSAGATTGSFNWTVTGPATSNARVRVTWTSNAEATDTSNTNFTIATPTISVSNPNSLLHSWDIGTTETITWTSSNLASSENVSIELSLDGGSTYPIVLFASTPNDGTQGGIVVQSSWQTNSARVRITWLNNTSVTDSSNSNFLIFN